MFITALGVNTVVGLCVFGNARIIVKDSTKHKGQPVTRQHRDQCHLSVMAYMVGGVLMGEDELVRKQTVAFVTNWMNVTDI